MIPTAVAASLLVVLSASPADLPLELEPIPSWELGTAVGGGWDSNPLGAPSAAGSSFGSARAWVARRFELSATDELRLELRYDGVRFDSAGDADLDRPELGLEWDHAFGERLLFRALARGAVRVQGDPARSGWDANGRALLRIALAEPVGLRLGLGWFHREADDAAYGGSSGRADAGVDVALWRRASAVAGYALEVGSDTVSSTSGTWSGRRMGGSGPAGLGTLVVRHTLSVDVLQALPGGFFLQGGYGYGVERGAGTSVEGHTVLLDVGWRR